MILLISEEHELTFLVAGMITYVLSAYLKQSDEIVCFTDGSRRGLTKPSGAAVYTQDDDQRYMFPWAQYKHSISDRIVCDTVLCYSAEVVGEMERH